MRHFTEETEKKTKAKKNRETCYATVSFFFACVWSVFDRCWSVWKVIEIGIKIKYQKRKPRKRVRTRASPPSVLWQPLVGIVIFGRGCFHYVHVLLSPSFPSHLALLFCDFVFESFIYVCLCIVFVCVCVCAVDWSISCSVVQINSVAQKHSIVSHLNAELSEPKQETTMLIEMREPGQIAWAHQEMIFNLLYARVHLFFRRSFAPLSPILPPFPIKSIQFHSVCARGAPVYFRFQKRAKKCTQLEIFSPSNGPRTTESNANTILLPLSVSISLWLLNMLIFSG